MTTPTALKEQGQEQAIDAADMRTVAWIDAVILNHVVYGHPFSANTIRAEMPSTDSRGLVGARVDVARKRGWLVAIGRERSTLPSTRSAFVTVWVGAIYRDAHYPTP